MLARSLLCSSCLSPLSLHFPDTLLWAGKGEPHNTRYRGGGRWQGAELCCSLL